MKRRNEERAPREFSWKEMPMLRLLLPLMVGIATGVSLKGFPLWIAGAVMAAGLLACTILSRRKIPYRLRHVYAISCLVFWLFAGVWLSKQYLATGRDDYFMNLAEREDVVWIGQVTETGGSAFPRATIKIQGCFSPFSRASGKALVYPATPLEKGQILLFRANFREVPAPKNPGGFDNKRYRFFQNIHHQAYLKEGDWEVIDQVAPHFLERWRDKQVQIWKENLKDTSVYSVATAMVLGYTAELPDEVRDTYAQTGATHVLSVSGLHVGLIYLLLTSLLRRWQSVKALRKLNFVLCLLGIWAFAILTGAGPAVLRAAVMFSFVLVGKQMRRRISIFNSLAASAFFLLWINPFWLFHIGFQLSYTALAGIVVFQPLFYHLWIPSNTWLDKIWNLTAVSLGAQLATLPLTLHYFHQFPMYFWLSGLVVVPASPFIIVLGILITLAHYILPGWIWVPSFLLRELIRLMNLVLEWIQDMPFSVVENLFLPKTGIILLFIAVLMLAWVWEQRRRPAVLLLLLLLNGAAASRFYSEAVAFCKEELVIYHVSGGTLVDYFYRGNLLTLKSEEVSMEMEERAAGPLRARRNILHAQNQLINGENLSISNLDLAILYGNPRIDLKDIRAKRLIADASNSRKTVERWKKECKDLGLDLVDIRETGFYSIQIKR